MSELSIGRANRPGGGRFQKLTATVATAEHPPLAERKDPLMGSIVNGLSLLAGGSTGFNTDSLAADGVTDAAGVLLTALAGIVGQVGVVIGSLEVPVLT